MPSALLLNTLLALGYNKTTTCRFIYSDVDDYDVDETPTNGRPPLDDMCAHTIYGHRRCDRQTRLSITTPAAGAVLPRPFLVMWWGGGEE